MDEELLGLDLDLIEVERARARQREAERQRQGDMTQYGEALQRVMARELPRRPAPMPSALDRVTGATSIALGPLARALAGGMAAAGSPGQRPAMGTTAAERFAEAEQGLIRREDVFGRDFPVTAVGLGLAGAVPRYVAASAVPGGPAMLGVAESLASRPQESLPGLAATVAGMTGRPEAQRRLQRVAESPVARAAADALGGEAIGGVVRLFPAARRAAGRVVTEGRRRAGTTAAPVQGGIQGPAIPTPGAPERLLLPAGARTEPETDPARLLAWVAQSLEGTRSSPFAPGAMQGQAFGMGPVPGGRQDFIAPIGPEIQADPDLVAQVRRLLQYAASPPSQTGFRNPETNRMAMIGGASATRRGPDVPMIEMSGGEPRRMVVPKQNVPGEVVRAIEERAGRSLQEMLEGRTNIEGMRPDVAASPLFLANTPIRTIFDEAAAPLTPPLRQTPETRQMFPTAAGPENLTEELRPSAVRTALEAAGPAPTVTRLDPGAFPYLVNRRAGGRGAVLPRTRQIPGGPVQRILSGSSETGPFADVPRPGVSAGEEGIAGAARGPRRAAMAEAAEYPTPEMEGMFDAPDFMGDVAENLRNREGFTTAQMLEALARAGVGGAGGGIIGGAMGETPEERRAFALAGLGFGMGLGGASGFIGRQSAQNRRINEALNEVERVMRRRRQASPTATPFSATGAPPGIARATITGAPGVAAASPAPQPRTAGEPIVRPTTVLPKDEPRLQRLNLTPEMQDLYGPRIRAISEEIAATGRQTWDDLKGEAARLLNVARETLADINPNRMTGAEALAIASLARENTENLARLAADFDAAKAAGDTAAVDRLTGVINDLEEQTDNLVEVFMKGTSAQGRALQAQRVLANLNTDPMYWIVKGQRVKGADVLTAAERNNIATLANAGPAKRDELMRYISRLRRTGILGQIAQGRRAGFLSGITGRIYDFAGTGANIVVEGTSRPVQAVVDRVASFLAARKVGGTTASQRSVLNMTSGEFAETMRGIPKGIRDIAESMAVQTLAPSNIRAKGLRAALREWSEIIRDAELDPQAAARLDVPRMVNITMFGESRPGRALNTLGDTYSKFFMRFSGITDKLYRAMAFRGAMQEQARLVATREGLTGPAFQTRVQDLMANPTEFMEANALYQSEVLTFTNDGALAKSVGSALEGIAGGMDKARLAGLEPKLGEVARGLGNINVPFRRTPSNLLTRVLEYTPGPGTIMAVVRAQNWWGNVALLAKAAKDQKAGVQAAVTRSQRKMVENLTRQVSGTGMIALGMWLWDNDLLTGDSPKDQAEAEQWRTEGRMPNAIRLGDKWFPISRLAPLGTVLSVGANYAQERQPSDGLLSTLGQFTGSAVRTSLDQPMLTGPRELLNAATGAESWRRENFMENMAGSLVPTAVATGARASGEQRMPSGMGEAIAMRIPGLEQSVPVRRNIFGEPLERAQGYFLPTQRDLRQSDPLVAELSRVGAVIPAMKSGKDENERTYEWRTEHAGRRVRAELERVVTTPRYRNASPTDQAELLENAASAARSKFAKEIKRVYNIESP